VSLTPAPAVPAAIAPRGRAARLLAGLLRFFGLWAGISGAYAMMGGTCPCCGNPGCPVGLGVAAILGALGSLIINYGRRWFTAVRSHMWRHAP
jgi:hypothetical protein